MILIRPHGKLFETDTNFTDPGVYLLLFGGDTTPVASSGTVDMSKVSEPQRITYTLQNGDKVIRIVTVQPENFFRSVMVDTLTDFTIDDPRKQNIQSVQKAKAYKDMMELLEDTPSRRAVINRQYMKHLLPTTKLSDAHDIVEVSYPLHLEEISLLDAPQAVVLILPDENDVVKLKVERLKVDSLDDLSGIEGRIVNYNGAYMKFENPSWQSITTSEESSSPPDGVVVTKLSDTTFSMTILGSTVVRRAANSSIVSGSTISVDLSTAPGHFFINNTGINLGSIVQTEGYSNSPISSSIIGDPYVTTLNGKLYKLPNKHCNYCLIQTDDLIINASVRPVSKEIMKIRQTYVEKYQIVEPQHTEYFVDEIYIEYLKKYPLLIDMDTNIKMDHTTKLSNVRVFEPRGKKTLKCPIQGRFEYSRKIITINGANSKYHIELRKFDHPQMVNGLHLSIRNRWTKKKPVGVLTGMHHKHCVIKRLTSTRDIEYKCSLPCKKKVEMEWRSTKRPYQ
jgi:hypothetical protein